MPHRTAADRASAPTRATAADHRMSVRSDRTTARGTALMYPNPISGPAIHHERRGVLEKAAQDAVGFGRQPGLVQRARHQRDPAIARRLVDDERGMALAQPRVPARFDVAAAVRRTGPPENRAGVARHPPGRLRDTSAPGRRRPEPVRRRPAPGARIRPRRSAGRHRARRTSMNCRACPKTTPESF